MCSRNNRQMNVHQNFTSVVLDAKVRFHFIKHRIHSNLFCKFNKTPSIRQEKKFEPLKPTESLHCIQFVDLAYQFAFFTKTFTSEKEISNANYPNNNLNT